MAALGRAAGFSHDPQLGTFLLQMGTSCYGLGLAPGDTAPRHLHWGPPVGHETLAAIARSGEPSLRTDRISWSSESPLELVPWGGMRYDEPTVKVDLPDGTRGIEWHLAGHRVQREEGGATALLLELRDEAYPLVLEAGYRIFDDAEVLERWALLRNEGQQGDLLVHQLHAASWWLPRRGGWRLRSLGGGWGRETQLVEQRLVSTKVVLESRRGTTSHQAQPWFTLDACSSTEEHGEVWSGALAWSGNWKLVVEQTPGERLHVSGGWNDFDGVLRLAPGESLATPVFAGTFSAEGFGGASRAWHDYQLRHVLSRPARRGPSPSFPPPSVPAPRTADGSELPALRPVLYNSWEATAFEVSHEGQSRLADLAARIGVELFVVDDGWFRGRRDARAGLGDWQVDREKFPHGLAPLVERVHALGMSFGLWVEPEMTNPDSDLYRAHPDWVYHFPHRARSERRNQLVLNLAREDVAEWVYATLDRLLSEQRIDFVKWDVNRHLSEPGWPAEPGGNPERAWVAHTRHLYEVLDRLRGAHPEVDFETCSGGGGRVDLGILSRTQQAWTSDNTDAWDRVAIQDGFSQLYAPLAMMAWVTDRPNPLTRRELPLAYRFHVAMAGSLGIGGDLTRWSEEELAQAADLVAQYKRIRPVVQHGRLHRLAASGEEEPFGAVEYLSRDGGEVVVLAWSGVRRFRAWPTRLRLSGLDPAGRYRDLASGEELAGATLLQLGLQLPGDLDHASALFHLQRLPT